MTSTRHDDPSGLSYHVGLDTIEEPVISSHFMQKLCANERLSLYGDAEFRARLVTIPEDTLGTMLLPALRRAADTFARDRAEAGKRRALANPVRLGVDDPSELGAAEFITEVMFDRQFRSGPRETASRTSLRHRVADRMAVGAPIEMAIAALPYKINCPLKSRGGAPDLAEVDFLLGLYEIVAAIDVLYREAHIGSSKPLARFTVISDGNRFNRITNEPEAVVEAYRRGLARWIDRLQLSDHVEVVDYRTLLRDRLPETAQIAKDALREKACRQYTEVMWALFDPYDMTATLRAAASEDPDSEEVNPEGRFVSLLKSLVFTVTYRCLEPLRRLPPDEFRGVYRELTGHLFEPFVDRSAAESGGFGVDAGGFGFPLTPALKEHLRVEMLKEVWGGAIAYVSEIKSDREQEHDPITNCLPNHLRWTIHAKPGQLGLLTSSSDGLRVLAWAGSAVFKPAKRGGLRLCTLPVLALEGVGATPVRTDAGSFGGAEQPLCYIHPDVEFEDVEEFFSGLASRLVRRRRS